MTLAAGRRLVGVAAGDRSLSDALLAALPRPVPRPAPRTLALVGPGPDPDGGPARVHHALWEASQEVVRCRTAAGLVRACVAWLDQWADRRPDGVVGFDWMAAIDGQGCAVLLPPHLRFSLHPLAARLRRLGLRTVDAPLVDLDPVTGELVVGRSAVTSDGLLPVADEAVPSGSFPIGHVVLPWGSDGGPSGPTEREVRGPSGPTEREVRGPRAGDAVAVLARTARPGPSPDAVLGALEMAVRGARLHRLDGGTADEIVAALGRSLAQAPEAVPPEMS